MLFVLFIIAIEVNEKDRLNAAEIAFMVYALGFTLEKIAAMQEHGIKGFIPYSLHCVSSAYFIFISIFQGNMGSSAEGHRLLS